MPIVIGGSERAARRRLVTWLDGFTIGGGPLEAAAGIVQAAWAEAAARPNRGS